MIRWSVRESRRFRTRTATLSVGAKRASTYSGAVSGLGVKEFIGAAPVSPHIDRVVELVGFGIVAMAPHFGDKPLAGPAST